MNQSNDMLSNALLGTTNDNKSVSMGLIAPVDAVMRRLGFDVMFKENQVEGDRPLHPRDGIDGPSFNIILLRQGDLTFRF